MTRNLNTFHGKRLHRLIAICLFFSLAAGLALWKFWPVGGNAQLKVLFSHFENVPGGKVAVFQVSNTGKKSVTVYGPGGLWPMHLIGFYDGTNCNYEYSLRMAFK